MKTSFLHCSETQRCNNKQNTCHLFGLHGVCSPLLVLGTYFLHQLKFQGRRKNQKFKHRSGLLTDQLDLRYHSDYTQESRVYTQPWEDSSDIHSFLKYLQEAFSGLTLGQPPSTEQGEIESPVLWCLYSLWESDKQNWLGMLQLNPIM